MATIWSGVNKNRADIDRNLAGTPYAGNKYWKGTPAQEATPISDINTQRRWWEAQQETRGRESGAFADYLARGGQTVDRIDAVADADVSRLDTFDPMESVRQYATSAWADVSSDLASQLDALQGANAKSGRLNTGYFDSDRGAVIGDATRRFQSMLGQQAVTAAGMSLDARSRASELAARGKESALGAALDRERMGGEMYTSEADRYRDMLAFNFDRNARRRQEKALNRSRDFGTAIGGLGAVGGFL